MIANRLTDYVDDISYLQTAYDVFRYTRRLADDFGAERFSIMTLDRARSPISVLGVVNNWDPELIAAYDEMGLAKSSPILSHLEEGNRVLDYELDTLLADDALPQRKKTRDLFGSFGMTSGLSCPVQDGRGNRGGIVFSGRQVELPAPEKAMLHLLSNYLYDHLVTISATSVSRTELPSLSGRELDCLTHAALGKTSKETARDLGLSDHTVTHYLALACKKLEAVNRVHAVAKALRFGLLC